jgi:type I restriction enzyme, S subunit
MSFPRYERYKDSGVEWLGEVPKGWDTLPIRRLSNSVQTGGTPATGAPSSDTDNPFLWYTPADFGETLVLTNSSRNLSQECISNGDVKIFPANSVLIVSIGATLGKVGFTKQPSSANQQINAIIPNHRIDGYYLAYSLVTKTDVMRYLSNASTIGIMNQEKTKDIIVAVPPLPEQTTIAAFLDCETAKIDNLINEQKKLIELLKEKRQAVISTAVTKGLNPHAPMKDSGVEWLGEVPDGWEVAPVKAYAKMAGRIGFRGYTTSDIVDEGCGAISLSPSNMSGGELHLSKSTYLSWDKYNESPEIMVYLDDIIMVKTGSTYGKLVFVKAVNYPMTINPQLIIIKAVKCNANFLFRTLSSSQTKALIDVSNTGGSIPTMTQEAIGNFPIAFPPLQEQITIVAFLDQETAKIDNLIQQAQKATTLLQERRTALISAAVTGKIDVRGFVTTNTTANCVGK